METEADEQSAGFVFVGTSTGNQDGPLLARDEPWNHGIDLSSAAGLPASLHLVDDFSEEPNRPLEPPPTASMVDNSRVVPNYDSHDNKRIRRPETTDVMDDECSL